MKNRSDKESNSVVAGILGFLSDRGKTNLLSSVTEVLDEVVDKTKHADKILITSATPMTREQLSNLRTIVSRFLKKNLPAVNKVDQQLVAGFTIRVGDFFLDASLAAEVAHIKRLLVS